MSARDLRLTISWFPTAFSEGPAIGDPERTTWGNFSEVFWWRREGEKDGPCFVPARFLPEQDSRQVRRLKRNLVARTAIALDCETNKETGELPPGFTETVERVRNRAWAAVVYTSHNHRAEMPRYRVVLPLSEEIDHTLPAVEIVADRLGVAAVLDRSKLVASSLFYLPSAEPDQLDHHDTVVVDGGAIDAAWLREAAGSLLAGRQAEADRRATEAHAEAAVRREAKLAAGFDPDDSLIEKLRSRFDLQAVLLAHGYEKSGTKYRHPNSSSGSFGADIKAFSGIERVFSHNANDPLHASNLPSWCAGVTALDVFDVVTILDFGGDRRKALADLADRFNVTKASERKALARLLFRLIRRQESQVAIETAAFTEGSRLGLARADIISVATWVATLPTIPEAA